MNIKVSLKEKLKNNELTIGSWIMMNTPMSVEVMALAGFEWLVVDIEHTSIDYTSVENLIRTIQANNIKALVRVSKNEEVVIKKVLDMGTDGIIVPMINSKEDALKAVEYAKYPPTGKRGVGLYRASKYGTKFEEYKKWVNEELVIIAQIEHMDAVNNIDEILGVEEIDGTIIGPYDLSGSMGYPGDFEREDVKNAVQKVLDRCKAHSIPSGFHVVDTDAHKLQQKIDQGCTFLAYGIDYFFMRDAAKYGKNLINHHVKIAYDNWSTRKKQISERENLPSFQEREVVFIYMGKNIGYEQDGKGDEFLRPVLIFKRFNKEQFLGFALTSQKKDDKFHVEVHHGGRTSYVILSQLRTYSARRIKYKTEKQITNKKMREVWTKFVGLVTPQ